MEIFLTGCLMSILAVVIIFFGFMALWTFLEVITGDELTLFGEGSIFGPCKEEDD